MQHFVVKVLTIAALLACSVAGCGSSAPEVVELGGARSQAKTVERPWGTVATFPELTKAQTPIAADTSFASDMVMHHEQAVELSDNLLSHPGVDERISAAARFIKKDQGNEIATMNAWLDAWRDSADEPDHSGHHQDMSAMPGMLPASDVDAVQTMPAKQAQIEFLRLMSIHHQGAITMSQDYLSPGKNSFTRSVAQHIIREQQVEIEYFGHTIDDLCATEPVAACPST